MTDPQMETLKANLAAVAKDRDDWRSSADALAKKATEYEERAEYNAELVAERDAKLAAVTAERTDALAVIDAYRAALAREKREHADTCEVAGYIARTSRLRAEADALEKGIP